jgi:hypothetical protein
MREAERMRDARTGLATAVRRFCVLALLLLCCALVRRHLNHLELIYSLRPQLEKYARNLADEVYDYRYGYEVEGESAAPLAMYLVQRGLGDAGLHKAVLLAEAHSNYEYQTIYNWDQHERLLRRCEEAFGADPEVLWAGTTLRAAGGQEPAACLLFDRLLDSCPDYPALRRLAGHLGITPAAILNTGCAAYTLAGREGDAAAVYRRFGDSDPVLRHAMVGYLVQRGELRAAMECLGPDEQPPSATLEAALFGLGEWERYGALDQQLQAVGTERNPDDYSMTELQQVAVIHRARSTLLRLGPECDLGAAVKASWLREARYEDDITYPGVMLLADFRADLAVVTGDDAWLRELREAFEFYRALDRGESPAGNFPVPENDYASTYAADLGQSLLRAYILRGEWQEADALLKGDPRPYDYDDYYDYIQLATGPPHNVESAELLVNIALGRPLVSSVSTVMDYPGYTGNFVPGGPCNVLRYNHELAELVRSPQFAAAVAYSGSELAVMLEELRRAAMPDRLSSFANGDEEYYEGGC